jgi:UDP:flavonoid glycosyltransferase YjiC (YdhE family)
MFPEWYAPLPSSYSLPIRLAGFPLYDRGRPLPPELLTFCQAGAPPIAITFGTGHRHAKQLFALATEAVGRVGGRALLLTRYKDQLPSPLPSYAQHCEYASFSQLLPHCGAIIHHGGVGTTAQALAAGIPQLIMPLAFDQPDNAARIKKLGSGDWVKPSSTVSRIAEKLSRILSGPMKERARTFRECLKGVDSCAVAVNWIEAESKLAEQAPRATH